MLASVKFVFDIKNNTRLKYKKNCKKVLPKGGKKISVPFKDVLVTKKQHRRPVWSALTYIGKKSCNSVATLNFKCRRFSSLKWDLKEHWTILLPCKIYPIAFLLLVRDADLTYREFMKNLQREITVGIKGSDFTGMYVY